RQQLHVAILAVLAALEAAAQARHRGLDDLHLVVGQEGAQRRAEDGDHLERERVQDDLDIAAVGNEDAEDAAQCEDPADDDKHVRTCYRYGGARAGGLRAAALDAVARWGSLPGGDAATPRCGPQHPGPQGESPKPPHSLLTALAVGPATPAG